MSHETMQTDIATPDVRHRRARHQHGPAAPEHARGAAPHPEAGRRDASSTATR
ncbi:MAG: hypothetical protein MZU84_04205 [Sphingobacterium sp.]|nr:hypothetical protein [Sphingobacterium sp.]